MGADEAILGVFEGKFLCKIFSPICLNGVHRHRMNHELYPDERLLKRIKIKRISCFGHVLQGKTETPEDRPSD